MPEGSNDSCPQVGAAAAALLLLALILPGTAVAQQVRLLETGSTLLYPLFNLWVADYAKSHPNVQITTQGTGSGTGIAQAISGIAQIGASDAYMSNAQMKKDPGVLNVPLAISSQIVDYNLPELNGRHLKFSGPALAGIYSGQVKYWDEPLVAKLNPGVKLPHGAIVPVHRTDGSGDTFIFSQYLSFSTPSWANSVGYGTTVSWPPVEGGIGAQGNPGMVNAAKTTPYALAYIGISFRGPAAAAGLGEALLQNRDGKLLPANPKTVAAAVEASAAEMPADQRSSLVFAPGAQSYPIVNYEYAIVKQKQASPEAAKALKAFLEWCVDPSGGNAAPYMKAVGFVGLPPAIAAKSRAQIASIK